MTQLAKDAVGNTLPAFRWGRMHRLAVSETPDRTDPFSSQTLTVGVLATADFRFKLGKAPTATESCPKILANMWVPLRVYPEETLSVVWCGQEGEVEITEMTK